MKYVILFILVFIINPFAFGQQAINGTVVDDRGQTLYAVNVYLKNTYDGAATDENGKFHFVTKASGQQTLIASFIGYKNYEMTINLERDVTDLRISLVEEINKIDGITISAGVFEASDKKKSVVLKTFDIVTTAGTTADVTGVMNTLPGTQTVGEEGRLFVRGGAGHEARTFINGLLVADPYGATPNNIPSRFRFSPFLFKGAFFSTGGYSAEYGQALSSVLQLNTYDLPVRSQTDISIMTVGADISQTIRLGNTSAYGQIQYTDLTPTFAVLPQKYDWKNAPKSINSTLHVKQKFKDGGNIQAYANFNNSAMQVKQALPGNIHELTSIDLNTQNLYTNLSLSNSIGKSISYHGGISYSSNKDEMKLEEMSMETSSQALHTKLVFDHDLSEKIQLKYGAEWIYDRFDEDMQVNQTPISQRFNYDNNLLGAFAEASIYFSNKLVARLGTRYEYNQILDHHDLPPRISLAYKLNQNSQFSMAMGRFSQLPVSQYLKRSTQLKPELATHYILNYQFMREGRIFRTELYYKKYDDLTTSTMLPDAQPAQLTNQGYGEAKGFELFWRDSKSWQLVDYWISYSYLDTQRKYDIFPYPVMPYYASVHNFSVVYKHFIMGIKSQVGVTYSFASGRPYTDPNTSRFNSCMTKNYHDLSLNYSYLFKPGMIFHASVSNVPGFNNVFGYQYNATPNEAGVYESIPIEPQAKRFLFAGFFITISKDKNANQLNNL